MNKESTRTEKSTPARAGVAARELIRRAKRASQRRRCQVCEKAQALAALM